MTYRETLKYIYESMPMYQRIGVAAYKADLENAYALDHYFQSPHKSFKTIHIAGTNGKGSVSHMLASVFQSAGYRTGLFTSPHLIDFRERIRVNGKPASQHFVIDFIEKHKVYFEKVQPSFFEMSVFMAFEYFRTKKVDFAIIETGLGGRLDTTNIITPILSVITNISRDHTHILGDTTKKIAAEKAGIINPEVPVIIGEHQSDTDQLFIKTAGELNSVLYFAEDYYKTDYSLMDTKGQANYYFSLKDEQTPNPLICDLYGFYQKKNIGTVLTAIKILNQTGLDITNESIKEGLSQVKNLTGLQGRWQVVSQHPLIICDTGHNEAGIKEIINQIKQTAYKKLHMILGFVSDKDLTSIIKLLPKEATYYLCQPKVSRAKNVMELKKEFDFFGLNSTTYKKIGNALKSAINKASDDDFIFIGGSNFVVADFLMWKKMKKVF